MLHVTCSTRCSVVENKGKIAHEEKYCKWGYMESMVKVRFFPLFHHTPKLNMITRKNALYAYVNEKQYSRS